MAILVLAEHSNAALNSPMRPPGRLSCACCLAAGDIDDAGPRRVTMRNWRCCCRRESSPACARCCMPTLRRVRKADGRSAGSADRAADGELRSAVLPRHHHRQERDAAHRRQARRHAALGHHESDRQDDVPSGPIYAPENGDPDREIVGQDQVVVTVRGTAFNLAAATGSASVGETIAAPAGPFKSTFVSEELSKSDRPELASAKRIVSGGRAHASAEQFQKYILPLADKLGAGVGDLARRGRCELRLNDYQVSQTGKIDRPGTLCRHRRFGRHQHLAGMKDSKVIVAINKDEEAPIFQIADFGLVGDLFKIVPELTEKLPESSA